MLPQRVELTGEIVEAKKKTQNSQTEDTDIHEECLCIESFVELDNLDGLVEHGVDEEVTGGVPVVEVDSETNGATSECVSGDEGVGNCGLLLRLHGLDIVEG